MINKKILDQMYQQANEQRQNAHAPYSGKFIGAAVLMKDGSIHSGCNVENASYGGTVCAERIAIFKAVSEGATPAIHAVMVVTNEKELWPPCGFCRQVIAEFAMPSTLIILRNPKGKSRTYKFNDLLPLAFSPKHLHK